VARRPPEDELEPLDELPEERLPDELFPDELELCKVDDELVRVRFVFKLVWFWRERSLLNVRNFFESATGIKSV
jgi:hypothetical protein